MLPVSSDFIEFVQRASFTGEDVFGGFGPGKRLCPCVVTNFRDRVLENVQLLAAQTVKDTVDQASKDTEAFLRDTREKIERWTQALSRGDLDRDEFELLVAARRSNMKLHALQAAGVTQNALERFRSGLISLLIESVFDLLP